MLVTSCILLLLCIYNFVLTKVNGIIMYLLCTFACRTKKTLEETELWIDDCNDTEVIDVSSSHSNANGVVKVYVMFLLSWQSLFRVSNSGINIVLAFFHILLSTLVSTHHIDNLHHFI